MNNGKYKCAYYALLKSNLEDNYYSALLQLVLYVFKKKYYQEVDIETLCKDFKKEIGFDITYFPMKKILSEAHKKGFVTYNDKKDKYVANFDLINSEPFMNNIKDQNIKFSLLVKNFKDYMYEQTEELKETNEIEKIINQFIEEQGTLLITQKENYFNNSHDDYLFAKYLEENQNDFLYINDLIVGRILSEYVLYTEEDRAYLKDLVVYLDSGFVFRLLGLDNLDRSKIYVELVNQMKKLGISIKIYSHTYNEIQNIIDNSAFWINNVDFDPSVSTETSYYFVSNSYTKEAVNEFSMNLKNKLDDFDIEIDDMDYPVHYPKSVITEDDYYAAIVEGYKENNKSFDEEEKKNTVYMDARSFFYTDCLCKGIMPNNLGDTKYLFVTTNSTLAYVLKKTLHNQKRISEYSIPFCITDKLLGIILWQSAPEEITEYTRNRLLISMNAAFMPSDVLIHKLVKAIEKGYEDGELTEDECYLLKTTQKARKYLMDITNGDPEACTPKTPLDIIKAMENDAREKGRKEEREISEKKINEKNDELRIGDERYQKLLNKSIDDELSFSEDKRRNLEEQKKNKNKEYEKSSERITRIEKWAEKFNRFLYFISVIILGIYLWIGYISWKNTQLEYLSFCVPVILIMISYLLVALFGKSLNVKELIIFINDKFKNTLFRYFNESYEENKKLKDEIDELDRKIKLQEEKSNKILAKRN